MPGLDDLCVRFILNIPQEELAEAERICFQIEEAQWFYEDFIRPLDPENLPSLNLHSFYMLISSHCPLLCDFPPEIHENAFQKFLAYKTRVPVRGAIMLNENMDEVVLVKGWKKNANWSFPRGKINKEEADLDCAIREVYEETGLDLKAAGLVPNNEPVKSIEMTMREQHMKLFVFRNVPMDTHFEPRTRKEISKIQWYKLSELPTVKKNKQQQDGRSDNLAGNANKFYMVAPFLGQLKKWIGQQRKQDKTRSILQSAPIPSLPETQVPTDSEDQKIEDVSSVNGGFTRLMDLLRRPAQPQLSDLPEVTTVIGPYVESAYLVPESKDRTTQENKSPTKDDLLALLRGKTDSEPPPQTPAAQIIEEPKMPRSPPHHHLSRMPTLPLTSERSENTKLGHVMGSEAGYFPHMKPAPPMVQPGKLVPQNISHSQDQIHDLAKIQQQTHKTGQVTTSSRYPYGTSISNIGQLAAPPASKLPPPKITPHTANLLNLFKTNRPTEGVVAEHKDGHVGMRDAGSPRKSSSVLVPSQISPKQSSGSVPLLRSISGQQASLLNLFRETPASESTAKPKPDSSLKPPSLPIELSAIPSPSHSREPSENRKPLDRMENREASLRNLVAQRRPLSIPSAPVSATVNGPLNIPQFDMITKGKKGAKPTSQSHGSNPEKPTQITILARPESSHVAPSNVISSDEVKPVTAAPTSSTSLAQPIPYTKQPPLTLVPPAVSPPPAPKLTAQNESGVKPFQPQILRRHGRPAGKGTYDLDEPSPIQALPSPKQLLPKSNPKQRQPKQHISQSSATDEHKKSLLSLFNSAASPATAPTTFGVAAGVSPPSGTPVAGGSSVTSALISPLPPESRSQQNSLSSMLAQQMLSSKKQSEPAKQEQLPPVSPDPFTTSSMHKISTSNANSIDLDNAPGTGLSTMKGIVAGHENGTLRRGQPGDAHFHSTNSRAVGAGVGSTTSKQTPMETRDKLLGILANIKA